MHETIRCEPQDHLVWKDGQWQVETDRTPLVVCEKPATCVVCDVCDCDFPTPEQWEVMAVEVPE